MFILGVGTAAPPQRYAQAEGWEAVRESDTYHALDNRARALLRKVLTLNNGIATRHLALDRLEEVFDLSPDTLHARFAANAPRLATRAAQQALANSNSTATEIDALLISTCTGYLCPGLTSYVSQNLGLRPDALLLDLVGQGCAAALPNLQTAQALLASGRADRVLSVCVEVCSAAFYLDNDPGVLISACIFGDGAGAAVLSRSAGPNRKLQWLGSRSLLVPKDRDLLRFECRGGMLRNILALQVPALAAEHVEAVLQTEFASRKMDRKSITGWVIHPGGRDVLRAVQDRLQLAEADLKWSAEVLREYGNVSSASVFFVLEEALKDSAPGGHWWVSSFGAGFSCHGALIAVE